MFKMIRAIVRPEKSPIIMNELSKSGFPAVTKIDVVGRGKQRGIKVGDVYYDEIPKDLLLIVVEEAYKDDVINIIILNSKTNKTGSLGDGKIFVSDVEEVHTISSSPVGL